MSEAPTTDADKAAVATKDNGGKPPEKAIEKTPEQIAATLYGFDPADVVKVHEEPGVVAVVTKSGRAIVDPGDALPVSVQRGTPAWQPSRDEPDPVEGTPK